jgi:hypothetical protein
MTEVGASERQLIFKLCHPPSNGRRQCLHCSKTFVENGFVRLSCCFSRLMLFQHTCAGQPASSATLRRSTWTSGSNPANKQTKPVLIVCQRSLRTKTCCWLCTGNCRRWYAIVCFFFNPFFIQLYRHVRCQLISGGDDTVDPWCHRYHKYRSAEYLGSKDPSDSQVFRDAIPQWNVFESQKVGFFLTSLNRKKFEAAVVGLGLGLEGRGD